MCGAYFLLGSRAGRYTPLAFQMGSDVSGLSPEQLRYLNDVLGVRGLVLPEGGPSLALAFDSNEVPAPEVVARGEGSRLVALFAKPKARWPFSTDERELADKMIQAMKVSPREVSILEWALESGEAARLEILHRLSKHPAKSVLFFGSDTAAAMGLGAAAVGQWLDWEGRSALVTLSLEELLQYPERKKIAWVHLQMVMRSV